MILSTGFSDYFNLSDSNWNIVFNDNFTRSNSDTIGTGWLEKENSASDCAINTNKLRMTYSGGNAGHCALNLSAVGYLPATMTLIRMSFNLTQTTAVNIRSGFLNYTSWNNNLPENLLKDFAIYQEARTTLKGQSDNTLATIGSGSNNKYDIVVNTSNYNVSFFLNGVYLNSYIKITWGIPQQLFSFGVFDMTSQYYTVENLTFYSYNVIVGNITNFNATTIYDNSTSHFIKYNNATNILLTATNSSGAYVNQLLNINCPFGINANFTAGTNYAITINNSLNNTCIISNAHNSSVNLTTYFYATSNQAIIFDNSTSHFVKINNTLLLNFTTMLNGVEVPSYLAINGSTLNVSTLKYSGEIINATFNSKQYYNHSFVVYDALNPSNAKTFYFISLNVYNLTTDYDANILVGKNNLISFDYYNLSQLTGIKITNKIYWNGTAYSGKTTNLGAVADFTGTNKNITLNFIINATYNNETLTYNYTYYQMLWKPFLYISNTAVSGQTFLNITFYDEVLKSRINATTSYFFKIIFDDESEIEFFNSTTNQYEQFVIVEPALFNYNVEIEIFYRGIALNKTYFDRTYYYINTSLSNSSQKLYLYSLDNSTNNARLNIVVKKQSNGLPLADYYVQTKRWFPDTDAYEIVETIKTDELGLGYTYIQYSDVSSAYYEFQVLNTNGIPVYAISKNRYFEPIQTLTIEVPDEYIISSIFDYAITSNIDEIRVGTTNILTATITNTKGNSFESQFNLTRYNNGVKINEVCTSSTISASTTYICSISDITLNNFNARIYVLQDSDYISVFNEWFDLRVFAVDLGDIGLILSIILVGGLITFGYLFAGTFGGGLGFIISIFILKMFNIIRINDYMFYTLLSLGVLIMGLIVARRE